MKKDFLAYIDDVITAMHDAEEFVRELDFETFAKQKMTVYAVNRAVEITGEATKQIPRQIKDCYPEIPWKDIAGMRDKVIHEYFAVDIRRVWIAAKFEFPALRPKFEEILKDFEKKEKKSKK